MTTKNQSPVCKFEGRSHGNEITTTLVAYREAELDTISDNFTPEETPADELFSVWVRRVLDKYTDGFIPIYWSVQSEPPSIYETMPFQCRQFGEDFLTFFSWPVNVNTNEPLNWLILPVVDKLWRPGRSDKGGFIQEFTHWKPSVLQPHVYLPALQRAIRP